VGFGVILLFLLYERFIQCTCTAIQLLEQLEETVLHADIEITRPGLYYYFERLSKCFGVLWPNCDPRYRL